MEAKIFFFILAAISMFVCAGGKDEYNKIVRDAWDDCDGKFTAFVENMRNASAVGVANQLASIFRYITVASLIVIFILVLFKRYEAWVYIFFVSSFLMWQGVFWYTRGDAIKTFRDWLFMPILAAMLPIMDGISGVPLTKTLLGPLDPVFARLLGFSVNDINSIWVMSGLMCIIILINLVVMFLMLTLAFLPIVFGATTIGIFSIWLARTLHHISGVRPMRPFMIFLGIISLAYFTFY
jgi:hypothetical protein